MNDTMNHAVRQCLVICFGLLLAACGGGDGPSGSATLQVAITDLPSAAYSSVTLSIRQIDVIASADDTLVNVTTLRQPLQLNVLDYRDYALQLGAGAIPARSYHQVRLVLAENPVSGAPVNYVTLNCSELPAEPDCNPEQMWALKAPSGHTSGLKIQLPGELIMNEGAVQQLTLDFDPATAIVERGDWDPARHDAKERFLFKPTGIRTLLADGLGSHGILSGSVAYADLPVTGPLAAVTAFDAVTAAPVAATLVNPVAETAAAFQFALAAGDYNLDVRANGYQPAADGPFTVTATDSAPHPETAAGLFTLNPL